MHGRQDVFFEVIIRIPTTRKFIQHTETSDNLSIVVIILVYYEFLTFGVM